MLALGLTVSPSRLGHKPLKLRLPSKSAHSCARLQLWSAKSNRIGRRTVLTLAVAGSGLSPELRSALEKFVTDNKVVLFIKGTKQFPQCGFSNTVVQIFNQLSVPYETVNVLDNELIRSGMKEYSQWPTFPQVYIDGEFFGGCDITLEAFQSGDLQETVERVMAE